MFDPFDTLDPKPDASPVVDPEQTPGQMAAEPPQGYSTAGPTPDETGFGYDDMTDAARPNGAAAGVSDRFEPRDAETLVGDLDGDGRDGRGRYAEDPLDGLGGGL